MPFYTPHRAPARLLAGCLTLAGCAHVPPPAPDVPDIQADAQQVVDLFITVARAQGLAVEVVPTVRVETTPNLIFYADQVVTVPRWGDLPPEVQSLFSDWARAAGGVWDGEGLFNELFHWFLIPHELGHDVQQIQGVPLGHFAAEQHANRIAVAWWALDPSSSARLHTFCEVAASLAGILPDPTPQGEAAESWFDEHYDALAQDPVAYGHYQFQFMSTACTEREAHPFGALVRPPD